MKGLYSLDKPGEFKTLVDMQYISAMSHPTGGKNDIPNRLKRHFSVFNVPLPTDTSLQQIFGVIFSSRFSQVDKREGPHYTPEVGPWFPPVPCRQPGGASSTRPDDQGRGAGALSWKAPKLRLGCAQTGLHGCAAPSPVQPPHKSNFPWGLGLATQGIPSSKGEQVCTPGRTNRHIHAALTAPPPPPRPPSKPLHSP